MVQCSCVDLRLCVRVPDDEIRILARGDGSFRIEPGQPRGRRCEPFGKEEHRNISLRCFRPHSRQAQLQGRDAAPGAYEITIAQVLQRWRRRRMIRGDEVDVSVEECRPEELAVCLRPNRRGALERRGAISDLLCRKHKVVRTGFYRHAKAAGPGVFQQRHGIRARQVHDVYSHPKLSAQRDEPLDGSAFAGVRPACEPDVVAPGVGRAVYYRLAQQIWSFGMYQQRKIESRKHRKRGSAGPPLRRARTPRFRTGQEST